MIDGLSYSMNFVTSEKGIYFISGERGFDGRAAIEFYDFSTCKRKVLAAIEKSFSLASRCHPTADGWFTRWWIMFPAI